MSIDPQNPYVTPVSDPIPETSPIIGAQLASLGERFLGSLIDGLIMLAIALPAGLVTGATGAVNPANKAESLGFNIGVSLVVFAVFLAINWKSLNATGQTIGKKVVKTRIVTLQNEKPAINDLLKRYAFLNLIGIIPFVGWIGSLVNVLFVFKADRRCIHDLIGKTKVIKATV